MQVARSGGACNHSARQFRPCTQRSECCTRFTVDCPEIEHAWLSSQITIKLSNLHGHPQSLLMALPMPLPRASRLTFSSSQIRRPPGTQLCSQCKRLWVPPVVSAAASSPAPSADDRSSGSSSGGGGTRFNPFNRKSKKEVHKALRRPVMAQVVGPQHQVSACVAAAASTAQSNTWHPLQPRQIW